MPSTSSRGVEEHTLSKAQLRRLVRRYWLVVLTVFLVGTIAMYVALPLFFTDLYESTSALLVRVGRENAETPATVQRGEVISQGVRMADINSEVQMLSSRALVESVVDQLGPDAFKSVLLPPDSWFGYPKYYAKMAARQVKRGYVECLIALGLEKRLQPREAAILAVSDGIKVEPVKDSDILTLKVRMPSQKLCMDVAKTLLDDYLQRRIQIRQSSAGSDFFLTSLKDARTRLDRARQIRAEVRARYNLTDPAEQRSLDLKELARINTDIVQTDADMAKLKAQTRTLAELSSKMPELVEKEQVTVTNPVLQTIRERLTTLQVDRAKIASHYQPGSEVLKKMDEEIGTLQAALAREQATILNAVTAEANPTKRELGSNLEQQTVQSAGLENRRRALRAPAIQLEEKLSAMGKGLDEFEAAEREYRLAEQDYLNHSKRYDEARMSEALDSRRIANVSIASPPDTPIKPVYPKKVFLMEIGMVVSLLLGLALAAFLETTEDRILDESCVLALGDVPYLGTVEISETA